MSFLTVLLIIVVAIYLVSFTLRVALPRVLMWWIGRQAQKQAQEAYRQAYGQAPPRQKSQGQPWSRFYRNGPGSSASNQRHYRRRGKIIAKDVGEYVEFEEIPVYNSPDMQTETRRTEKYATESQISDAEWEDIK